MINFKKKFVERYGDPKRKLKLPDYLEKMINETNKFFGVDTDCFSREFSQDELNQCRDKYKRLKGTLNASCLLNYSRQDCIDYNTFYLQANFLKIHLLFYFLFEKNYLNKNWFESKEKIEILDVGTGPGTNILAFLDFMVFLKDEMNYKIPKLKFVVIEKNEEFINIFRKNVDNVKQKFELKNDSIIIEKEDAINYKNNKNFHFIFFGNIINEIVDGLKIFNRYVDMLKEGGLITVIETDSKDLFIKELRKKFKNDNLAYLFGGCGSCDVCQTNPELAPCVCYERYFFQPTKLVEKSLEVSNKMLCYIDCFKKK